MNRLLQVEQQEQDAALEASGAATNDEQDAELEASGATTNDEQVAAQETSGAADEPVHNTSGNSDATVANEEKQIPGIKIQQRPFYLPPKYCFRLISLSAYILLQYQRQLFP